MSVTIEGLQELRSVLQRTAAAFPDRAGAAFMSRSTIEVRQRESMNSWRKPLDITRDGLQVFVAWPYPNRGGEAEGTYLTRVTDAAASFIAIALETDLARALEESLP